LVKSQFATHCEANNQSHIFYGVGSHWQNEVVECYIGHLTSHTCMMLLRVMWLWPAMVSVMFWPYATISHEGHIHDHLPQHGQQKSPFKLFTNETYQINLNDFHVFGCPILVLVKELQDGKSSQKFSLARRHMGIYIGNPSIILAT
jgi:hypothetical protein